MHQRRYDVDWLRVIAFLILIFYHTGMYYVVEWDWHIKSPTPVEWLHNLMVMSNLWRMSLLFFISGITLALIEKRYSSSRLLRTRTLRLFIPLLFGMFIIVPPQVYYELLGQGQLTTDYLQFWLAYINPNTELLPERHSPIGLLTWNHLWYLVYLWFYTLLFITLRPLLKKLVNSPQFQRLSAGTFWLIFATLLLGLWVWIRPLYPATHGLVDDWYNHAKYLLMMLSGYCLANRLDIWQQIIDHRHKLIIAALLCYGLIALDRNGFFPWMGQAFKDYVQVQILYGMVMVVNMGLWILTLTGLAGYYLNRPSRLLNYCNQAILPWYMLHQTLIILLAVLLMPLSLTVPLEATLIIVGTGLICLISYEVIQRIALLRLMFGLSADHGVRV